MKYLIGCDIGTSGTKVILFDMNGSIMYEHSEQYQLYQPKAGWAEQDANDWWEAAVSGIRSVLVNSYVNASDIKGIGLSGQMHGLVMLDEHNKPLRRAIIWCDGRTSKECEDIEAIIGRDHLVELTGNPALTGFTLSKLLWVRNNEPEIYKQCKKILLPKDYIRFKLTETFGTEVSDASGMQMLNINTRKWSMELLEKLNIDYNLLPEVFESADNSGVITEDAALTTGLKAGTIVAGGAGDQAAAAIGNGVVQDGVVSVTLGSSGVVFAMSDKPEYDIKGRVHTFCHAIKGKWHIMGVTQGAGISMNWFKETFYTEAEKKNTKLYKEIDSSIAAVEAGAEGLIFLPYLMGERTPHLDPDAKGVFFGITARHERKHFARAVMEGVSYSIKDCLDIVEQCNANVRELRLCGGGAKSIVWRQMICDILGYDLSLSASAESGCLGVAMLAAVASGLYKDVESAANRMVKTSLTLHPDPTNKAYLKAHKKYKALYDALKGLYK